MWDGIYPTGLMEGLRSYAQSPPTSARVRTNVASPAKTSKEDEKSHFHALPMTVFITVYKL